MTIIYDFICKLVKFSIISKTYGPYDTASININIFMSLYATKISNRIDNDP